MNITEIHLITPIQATMYSLEVQKLESFWVERGSWYTLGASTYLDNPRVYSEMAKIFNPVISKSFSNLIAIVGSSLGQYYGKTPIVLPGIALPGFHIFDWECNDILGHPHVDEPHLLIPWAFDLEDDSVGSFTLLLEQPRKGAGLDVWHTFTDREVEEFIQNDTLPQSTFHRYQVGHLYIHDGLTPHRIANTGHMTKNEFRITLQGHTIVKDNELIIYF